MLNASEKFSINIFNAEPANDQTELAASTTTEINNQNTAILSKLLKLGSIKFVIRFKLNTITFMFII